MAVETDIERAIFFSDNDFGDRATYTPQGGQATQINGIFDNEYALIDAGGGVGVASREPKFQTETINVPNAADGDTLVVNSITYKVRVVEPDGTGTTTLMLEKQ